MDIRIPESFLENICIEFGEPQAGRLSELLNSTSPVTVRVNPMKVGDRQDILDLPIDPSVKMEGRSEFGRVLKSRPVFTLDPLFHAGCYYVQEASSMAIESCKEVYAKLQEDSVDGKVRILDLCAAPGGKSTHLLSIFRDCSGAMLVSNEVIRARATILAENIAKWGAANVVVSNNDPADFGAFAGFFDMVVVDAPCSGEGMFRKDPASRQEWSPEHVDQCAARQRRIVADIWPALRSGGIMLYSTCTFNHWENGDNLNWIASELGGEVLHSQQCFPGEQYGEGFFYGIVRKSGDEQHALIKDPLRGAAVKPYKDSVDFAEEGYVCYRKGDLVKGYPVSVAADMIWAESHLRCVSAGAALASVVEGAKGRTMVPEADIALSEALRRGSFPEVEVSLEDALRFLRKDPLAFPSAPKGYLLLTYKGVPLGFVKNIGNRTNNLWPQGWRIRNV
ncbi:MAG: rRNA cytosine-C5-methyltransferase [Bacteroidales bacterium]|nr:rRNA cytosine-C5-methyltransferase [Bacteroidales bacterium]